MKLGFKSFALLILSIGIVYSALYKFDKGLSDFPCYYLTGKRILAKTLGNSFSPGEFLSTQKIYNPGDSLYNLGDVRPFKYTPTVAYLFAPFSLLTYPQARIAWFLFCYCLLILSFYLIHKYFKENSFLFFLLLFLLPVRFFLQDMKFLQINLLIIFLFTVFFYFRKKRENLAALALAALVGIKILPVFFLFLLLLEKDYRLFLKTIGMGILLILLPLISYGSPGNLLVEYLNYFQLMREGHPDFPATASYWIPNVDSFIVRLFMDRPYVEEGYTTNILNLSANMTYGIILGMKALFFGLLILAQRNLFKLVKNNRDRDFYYLAMIALVANFINIINPVAWKHGLASVVFSWLLILLRLKSGGILRLGEKVLLFLVFMLQIFPYDFFSKYFKRVILGAIGVDFLGMVAISALVYLSTKELLKISLPNMRSKVKST